MLEHGFIELGHPTLRPEDVEAGAERLAVACRMKSAEREFPAFIEMAKNIEKRWACYVAYLGLGIFGAACLYGCVFLPQLEVIAAEAERQTYVRT